MDSVETQNVVDNVVDKNELKRKVIEQSKKDMSLRVKKLNKEAILPVRKSAKAAGYDLSAITEDVIPPKSHKCIKIGLAIGIPEGYYGRIAPRSGLALKNRIFINGGVVDVCFYCDFNI